MQKTPLIEPKKVDISSTVLAEVKAVYGADVAKSVKSVFEKIDAQREIVRNIKGYTTADDINQYYIYLDYLRQMNDFIPLENKHCPKFEWKSVYGKAMKCADIRFEICCVLLNLGILYCQAAFNEYLVEDRSEPRLRKVIDNFKMGAGFFQKIKREYQEDLQIMKVGEDLHPKVIQIYYLMSIAQCQHMYFILGKTISEDKTPLLAALAQSCSKFYSELGDLCLSHKFFPADLGKHFKLQSYFTKILAIHYYGQTLLKRQVEENAGKAFALARELGPLITTTKNFMNSFHLEQADLTQGEMIFNLVINDRDQFYNLYRIFNTNVPESVEIPFGDKAVPTSDLNLNEFPLGLVIPENESVEKAIAEYQQKKNKLLEECRMDGDELYRKVDNELMNRSLPDIFDGSVLHDLPATTKSRLDEIKQKGGIKVLQEILDKANLSLLETKEACEQFIQANGTRSEYLEQCKWMNDTLNRADMNIKKADQMMGTVNANAAVLSKSSAELAVSIPVCNEPMNVPPASLNNMTSRVIEMKRQYNQLIRQLQTENSGENTIRRKFQDPKNLLLKSTILSEAFTPIEKLSNEIKRNISLEKQYLEALQSEYDHWISRQRFSPAMKARLDSIRSINHAISCYFEIEDISLSTLEVLSMVKDVCH